MANSDEADIVNQSNPTVDTETTMAHGLSAKSDPPVATALYRDLEVDTNVRLRSLKIM